MKNIEDVIFEHFCNEADEAGFDILDENVLKMINDKTHEVVRQVKKAGKDFKSGFKFQRGGAESNSDATGVNTKPVNKITRVATKAGMATGKVANVAEEKAIIALAKAFATKNNLTAEFNKWKATGQTKLSEFKSWLKSNKKNNLKESYFNY